MDVPAFIIRDLQALGEKYNANYISLFGSRAKGTNGERSDIDIAVSGIDDVVRFSDFRDEVENIRTLLMFDIVNLESNERILVSGAGISGSEFRFAKDDYQGCLSG